jgi:hypothetical protein
MRRISISKVPYAVAVAGGIDAEMSKDFVVGADDLDVFFLGGFGAEEVEDVHAFLSFLVRYLRQYVGLGRRWRRRCEDKGLGHDVVEGREGVRRML